MGRALLVAVAVAVAACAREQVAVPPTEPVASTAVAPSGTKLDPTTTVLAATTSEAARSSTIAPTPSSTSSPAASTTVTPLTAVAAPSSTTAAPSASVPAAPSTTVWVRPEWPVFVEGAAPSWPFHGVVQLWPDYEIVNAADGEAVGLKLLWSLLYWSWEASPDGIYPRVDLPGLRIDCLGQVALVYDEHGVEVGGALGAVSAAFRVPWGGTAHKLSEPSGALLAEAAGRPSNVAVSAVGDTVRVGSGDAARSYAMRDPVRVGGERWRVQARHDGELFMLTVHPAHLGCYSGVTWLSMSDTGEFVMCGANSAAAAFVTPAGAELAELVLPDPGQMGTYLSCAAQLDLYNSPLTPDRRLP